MGHKQLFEQIVFRKYLPKVKAFKERWNHQNQKIGFPIVNAYSLNETNYFRFLGAIDNYEDNARRMIYDIIVALLKEYNYQFHELPINGEIINAFFVGNASIPIWTSRTDRSTFLKCIIIDVSDLKVLFVFRDFGIHNRIADVGLQRLRELSPFDGFFYVSFVFDKAYEEIIDHNNDESDVTKGTQCLSLSDFFLKFFDASEYDLLCKYLELFKSEVVEYMGVTVTRTLQPNAIPSFKRDLITDIIQKDYYATLCKICQDHTPPRLLIDKVKEQFIDQNYYTSLISTNKFSISFLTAEWLYSSLNNVVTIDQTPIILGYFKAMEQLLFDYVSFQAIPTKANRLKTIKMSKNSTPQVLNKALLSSKEKYMTIGTFTLFLAYSGNRDLIRSDLLSDSSLNAYGFISNFLGKIAGMRNEYVHRENINNWKTVNKVRDTAFSLFFILLGAYTYEPNEKATIGISCTSSPSPMILLCEYIHRKALEKHDIFEYPLFYLNHNYNQPLWPDPDYNISYDQYGSISYSGIYFHSLGPIDSSSYVELSFSLSELTDLIIEEDVYIINKEDPSKSHIKGDKKIVYQNGVFVPRE